jgi:hypothetical protein
MNSLRRGHAIAYLVETLCYKPEGRVFDSWWGHWIFQLTSSFQPHYYPGVDSASNRNEYQESSWGKGRPACKADNLTAICEPIVWKMWEPWRLTILWASTACYRDSSFFFGPKTFLSKLCPLLFLDILSNKIRSSVLPLVAPTLDPTRK